MPRLRPLLLAPTVLAVSVAAAGCGAERRQPPDIARPFVTQVPTDRELPAAGLRFRAPGDLPFTPAAPPLVASASTGTATVAIWRYPRAEPLPRDDAALEAAETALEGAARVRDPELQIASRRRVRVADGPAIELSGTTKIAGAVRRVRSTHLYRAGAEIVVDAYASPRDFAVADRAIFGPLLRSLEVRRPGG